jgi:RHS repeat-associated protein
MVFDETGSLANVKRHDYLPFGEELLATQGARTSALGYGGSDGIRQKFTGYERDSETELDFAQARYYSSLQGRFASPDSVGGSKLNPQTLNLYSYTNNNPLRSVDPSGHWTFDVTAGITLGQDPQDPPPPPPPTPVKVENLIQIKKVSTQR